MITYGRSVPSIGEQLFATNDDMSDEEKTKEAQNVYDSVLRAFPALLRLMQQSQAFAHNHGYVETILGRRRHLPDMMLNEFEFEPLPGYVNPDVDPLDLDTLEGEVGIPEARISQLRAEFAKFKYYGQIAKRTKELYEKEHIKVINNRPKINDAKRQCVNCVDSETEILTLDGWKRYDQVHEGDSILSYSEDINKLTLDKIQAVHIQKSDSRDIEVLSFQNSTFDAVCTENHRWVMRNFDTNQIRVYEAEHLWRFNRPRYNILRIAPNEINDVMLTDSTDLVDVSKFVESFYGGELNYSDIFKLASVEANAIYDYFKTQIADKGCIKFNEQQLADLFQVLALMAGKVSNQRKHITKYKRKDDVVTWDVTCSKKDMYETARLETMKKVKTTTNLVWCVTTLNGTWIARRNGKYYITGNSIIQGSAADFTKTALLSVATDPRWEACGGQILTVVHDEIIAQAPIEYWEEAAKVLREDMEGAGSFLPFPINCDVEVSYRWYGLEAPCKYKKPKRIDTEDFDEIRWLQYHLVELEYHLPSFKDADGNDPIGDAAHGISGQRSPQMEEAIIQYCDRYNILEEDFIKDIEQRVEVGYVTK